MADDSTPPVEETLAREAERRPLAATAAVSARRPEFTSRAPMIVIAGAVATFVGILVGQISLDISLSDFAGSHDHTTAAAHDALQPGGAVAAGFIAFLGHVALGLGIVLVALNAMRVGLLTRSVGVLGIMAGIFLAFPFFPVPIVQGFWLIALGVLILGRWPAGVPPAWETGRAEPWPSRQEMLEARGAGGPAPATEPPIASADEPADPVPAHPRSEKKKRRR